MVDFLIFFEWSYVFISMGPTCINLLHSDTILQKGKRKRKRLSPFEYTVPLLQINYAYLYNVKMHYITCIWCSISESIQDLNFRLGIQTKLMQNQKFKSWTYSIHKLFLQMGGLECVITGLMDEFKDFFKRWHINREIFTGMIVSVSFVVALCCVTPVCI